MGGAYNRLWEGPTGEEVSDLLDEGAQLFVAPVHPLLGLVGLLQDILSAQLGLVCLQLGLRHLDMNRTTSFNRQEREKIYMRNVHAHESTG